jgi:hypothetical protein
VGLGGNNVEVQDGDSGLVHVNGKSTFVRRVNGMYDMAQTVFKYALDQEGRDRDEGQSYERVTKGLHQPNTPTVTFKQ